MRAAHQRAFLRRRRQYLTDGTFMLRYVNAIKEIGPAAAEVTAARASSSPHRRRVIAAQWRYNNACDNGA